MRRAVLITGASSGIGAVSARVLVARGFRVWAGVRSTEAAGRLSAATTIADDGGLFGLVNNAGIAVGAPLEAIPLDALREQFEINVFGALAVTQAMLPLLRRTVGRIVMISSCKAASPRRSSVRTRPRSTRSKLSPTRCAPSSCRAASTSRSSSPAR
jgi:NAD(P)-dependent dehydrogenase (short-subunit alcohol dehydrogenase family)